MYHFLFAFLFHYYTKFRDGSPRNSSVIALSLILSLNIFFIVLGTITALGLRPDFEKLGQNNAWLIYGILPFSLILIGNFSYFNSQRVKLVLNNYRKENILSIRNGILIFTFLLILPIVFIVLMSPRG